jgi:serine/threonine protein kinase
MQTQRICPSCRKPLPPDVPLGLCSDCLLKTVHDDTRQSDPAVRPTGGGFVPPTVGEVAGFFPQLEILKLIGTGGMGAVYKARQPGLDRLVALKVLPPTLASDAGFAERFNREARALARLNHTNIVTVHDFGQVRFTNPGHQTASLSPVVPTLYYLLMELVDGGNLRQIEQTSRLTPAQAFSIIPQICEALEFAHGEGIVHRDIKPENILLDKRGRVKITDFGIAKMVGGITEAARLTGARDVIGTLHYMAPEQLEKPLSVDHRADIYSLGVVFYEMLTGELPLGRFAPPSRKAAIDARLDQVVLHALEKEPSLRYQKASELKTAVEAITRAEAPRPKPLDSDASAEPDALEQEILGRDYVLEIGKCVRRGWALLRSDFWQLVGTTTLILLLLGVATRLGLESKSIGKVTFSTSFLSMLLSGPLMGGLYFYLLKRIRGERVRTENAFAGFGHSVVQLFLAGFVMQVLTVLGFVCLILPGIHLLVAWLFTLPLIIDKRLEFWPALRLSRKTIIKHWWKFFGFVVVLGLMNLAGLLACGIGILVTLPVSYASLMFAYEDIINPPGRPAPVGTV